jgi:tRNA-specific 2-thiouridylase
MRNIQPEKIAVLLSGGVDSSVVLKLVKEKYPKAEIKAFTLFLFSNYEDINNARKVAEFIGVPHEILDLSKEFQEKIINYFIEAYKKGLTPNPCVICNRKIKLGLAVKKLIEKGYKKIFTGHYVRKEKWENFFLLKKAKAEEKDQTYFLALIFPQFLPNLEFPLGNFSSKEEVKLLAKKWNLPTKERKESQDICFIPNKKIADFLKKYIPPQKGFITYREKIIGVHEGYYQYTIGQRRGLKLKGMKERLYVKEIIPEKNLVIVGRKEELFRKEIRLKHINYFVPIEKWKSFENLFIKIRYKSPLIPISNYRAKREKELIINTEQPVWALTPGQVGAIYSGEGFLLAGGIISF